MTFLELQNAVMGKRFKDSQRADIKTWINHRYWWLWTLEDWTFTEGEALLTVTGGSKTIGGLPSDIRTVNAILDSTGTPLAYMPSDEFFRTYYGTTTPGTAEAWTRVGSTFYAGPTPGASATDWKLVYRKEYTKLVNDNDVPALPEGSHLALVHGADSEGRKRESDPMWQAAEQDFAASVDILRAQYLVDQRGDNPQWPAFSPGW